MQTGRLSNAGRALFVAQVVGLACAAPPIFAAAAPGEITWSWTARDRSGPAVVEADAGVLRTGTGRPSIALTVPSARVEGFGPLATTLDFDVKGKVDTLTRTIGAGARIRAEENAWDPRNPPSDPGRKVGEARVLSTLTDTVRLTSLSRMVANGFGINFIDMDVRASALSGIMTVPLVSSAAAGTALAAVRLDFELFEVLPGGAFKSTYGRSFEKQLFSGGPETLFTTSSLGPDPLGGRRFPLQNGVDYVIRLALFANVLMSGDAFPANDPPAIETSSRFESTFTFGGLFDFRDEQGNPLDDVTLTSEAGIDWLSPIGGNTTVVPLPASLALLAGGLPLLWALARRGQPGRRGDD